MFRQVVQQQAQRLAAVSKKPSRVSTRWFSATSREKRALNQEQLGEKAKAAASPPPPPAGGGGSSSSAVPAVLAVAALGGGGVAYYQGLIPGISPHPEEVAEAKQEKKVEAKVEPVEEKTAKSTEKVSSEVKETETETETKVVEETAKPNRVQEISLPEGSKRSAPPAAVGGHPEGGNRVAMEPKKESKENSPTVDDALVELRSQLSQDTSVALSEAHQELAKLSSLDLKELDNMTATQLKIRLVQLAKDLEERTKWEAVRLKEFLAMKEKEVEDKYIVILKKQRLEAEASMEQKMKEQEYALTSHMQKTISEKEQALQSIVDNSLKIQEQQYNEEKAGFEKSTEEAINAKYEELFGKSLAEAKQSFASKMEQKVQQIESLTKKLSELEFALQNTKNYQTGSMQAHRMSAAALSLIDTLETSKPAAAAIAALQSVAEGNAVVTSALASLPASVKTSGIASLQELQSNFEQKVFSKCREAALIPAGQQGLEGQLMGMLYATVKFPPAAEDAAPEADKDGAEYLLARAKRHVQLGELEQAAEQMNKLTGAAKLVAKDWTQAAKERVAIEKALRVIRLECALANESMAKAPEH